VNTLWNFGETWVASGRRAVNTVKLIYYGMLLVAFDEITRIAVELRHRHPSSHIAFLASKGYMRIAGWVLHIAARTA
jgi:hypothetical protein